MDITLELKRPMSKQNKKIDDGNFDANTKIDNFNSEIKLLENSVGSCTKIKQSLEEHLHQLLIKPSRYIRAQLLITCWRCGFLKREQSEQNNKFIGKFMELDSTEKLSFIAQGSQTQLVHVFSLSSDTTLLAMLSHCSKRASNLILADILYSRLNNNISVDECAKCQAMLVKKITQNSF